MFIWYIWLLKIKSFLYRERLSWNKAFYHQDWNDKAQG